MEEEEEATGVEATDGGDEHTTNNTQATLKHYSWSTTRVNKEL